MKVLILGWGGREHALAWKVAQSSKVNKIYVSPGNAGTVGFCQNVDLPITDAAKIAGFAASEKIDLTIVGRDDILEAGVVDQFQARGLRIFGPSSSAFKIESSKVYAKQLMKSSGIPTADYAVFKDFRAASKHIKNESAFPKVIKATGLAGGKGVIICESQGEAIQALDAMMLQKEFGDAGREVVIEEYLDGPEVSIHAICDGQSATVFPTSRDYKPVFDGNKGPNTGGLGAFTPVSGLKKDFIDQARTNIIEPALVGLKSDKKSFTGCLYPGLKLTLNGPKVLEFNARFGDPEAQVYMRLLESDLLELIEASLAGELAGYNPVWRPGFAVSVVMASGGYPGEYQKGLPITGIDVAESDPDVVVFHAGTKLDGSSLVTSGGRVLNVTAIGLTLEAARSKAYQAVEKIHFEGAHFRTDIGLL